MSRPQRDQRDQRDQSRRNQQEDQSDTKKSQDSRENWSWYKSLWKYKYEIAAAVVVTGAVLGFVVATHGVGALAVGVVAAHYGPAAIAGLTLGSVGIGGLAGFALNKAFSSNKSKSPFKLPDFMKSILGTDNKTKNMKKIVENAGMTYNEDVLGQVLQDDRDSGNNPIFHYDPTVDTKRVEVPNPSNKATAVEKYRKTLLEQENRRV